MNTTLRRVLHAAPWLIALLAFAVHAAVLGGDFLYDDLHSVRDNPALRELSNVPAFFVDPDAFSQLQGRMYRPVLLASLAWTWSLGDGAHLAHALFDLLLHCLHAAMLLSVMRGFGVGRWAACGAGALFAVHPLVGEAVFMVSARSDQLLLTGILTALLAHQATLRGSRLGWLGVVFGCVVACGSKETGVLVPVVLVAVELWARSSGCRAAAAGSLVRVALRLAPAAAVSVLYLVLRKVLLGVATASPSLSGGSDVTIGGGRDLLTQFATMGELLPRLVVQSVLPIGLSVDPPLRYVREPWAMTASAGWLGLAALAFWIWWGLGRRRPVARVGLALVVAVALPWVVVPLNAPLGEHRAYGCVAGLALIAAAAFEAARERSRRSRLAGGVAASRLGPAALAALLLVGWGGLAGFRAPVLAKPESAWRAALRWNPSSSAAWCSLAQLELDRSDAALQRGDRETRQQHLWRALSYAQRAAALGPRDVRARSGLIRIRLALGPEAPGAVGAVVAAEQSIDVQPRNPFRRLELSRALTLAGRATGLSRFFDQAVEAALSTLEIAAPKGRVFQVAAEARRLQGALDDAVQLLDRSIALGLDHADLRCDRAALLLGLGRHADARAELGVVLRGEPFHPRARAMLQAAGPGR